jgi:HK97 family phage portal protein
MNIFQRLFRKESQARIALSFRDVGNPINTPRNYESFSKEGYQKNVTVFRCVSIISKACAGIDWEMYTARKGGKPIEVEQHELIDLLKRPNPMQGRASFLETFVAYYVLTGNSFIEAVRTSEKAPPTELWSVRPDKMQIVPNAKGYPGKYILKNGEVTRTWIINPVTLQSNIYHMKSFHPLNDWWGMSPLEASMYALDQNNYGQKWNLALLQNSATPSGVLQMKATDSNPGGMLTEPQFARLKTEVEAEYSGAKNAGRPMLIEGGLEWRQTSMSPKDMEFLKAKEVTAIDICQAFGVPPEMLGLGQKTYSNYTEARMSFYEDTVLPLMDLVQTELNNWLVPMFGENIYLCYDKDDIEALAPKREKKFTSVQSANWLTINEKRTATGYEPVEGWDVFNIGNDLLDIPMKPEPIAEDPPPVVEEIQEQEDAVVDDEEKSWKSFNPLNRNERMSSWKYQNNRRNKLEKQFSRDLSEDLREMSSDMKKEVRGKTDARMIEFALLKTMDEHLGNIKNTLKRHIKYTVDDFGNVIFNEAKSLWPGIETKSTRQWEDWAARYVKKRTADSIGQIEGTTKKQVQRVVKKFTEQSLIEGTNTAELASNLMDEFSSLGKSRATLIARTEVSSASNNASLNAAKSLQLPNMVKEWVSSTDERVRDGGKDGHGPDHEAMNGVEVPMEEKFTVPPDTSMEGPGDADAGADQICNCRCVLVFKSKNQGNE